MEVEVYNRYYEYIKFYWDIDRIEENDREFILYIKGGFSKSFSKTDYSYSTCNASIK